MTAVSPVNDYLSLPCLCKSEQGKHVLSPSCTAVSLCTNSAPRTRLRLEMENVELTCHELSRDSLRSKSLD